MDTNTDEPDEPEMMEVEWDREQVDALFEDLGQGAQIQHVQVRTQSGDRAVTLAEAHDLFQQGQAPAIQIRYHFDGQEWCDTLMVGAERTRIIRTRSAITAP